MNFTFLPANLDLQEIVRACPPSFDGFDIDKLTYLLGLIESVPLKPKNEKKDGFTLLSSRHMQSVVIDYSQYFAYAHSEAKLIDINASYRKHHYSKGYRFKEPYTGQINKVTYQSKSIPKKLRKKNDKKFKSLQKHKYLNESFENESLNFNYDLAVQANDISYQLKSSTFPDLDPIQTLNNQEVSYKNHKDQYNQGVMSFEKIKNREWNPFLDLEGNGRFYHSLCNLPSKFRHLLSYEGKSLVSLDLKNSQPYLFCRLLQPDFFFTQSTISKTNDVSDPHKFPDKPLSSNQLNRYLTNSKALFELNELLYKKHIFSTSSIDSYNHNRVNHYLISSYTNSYTTSTSNPTIFPYLSPISLMLLETLKHIDIQEVKEYSKSVSQGTFYDQLTEDLINKLSVDEQIRDVVTSRDLVKNLIMIIFFSPNNSNKHRYEKKLFEEQYPTIYKLIKRLKSFDEYPIKERHKYFPFLLQRLEAYLFLEVIAKKFKTLNPLAPLFSIHDSIITTVDYEHELRSLMEKELTYHIGIPPTMKPEYWTKDRFFEIAWEEFEVRNLHNGIAA